MNNPITINITNLIGTMIIVDNAEISSSLIGEKVIKELVKVLAIVQNLDYPELTVDKSSKQPEAPQN